MPRDRDNIVRSPKQVIILIFFPFILFFALYFSSQYQWFFLSLLPFLILEIKNNCVQSHYTLYHKDSTTCRPHNKVEPCFAGFVPGWVTKNEYPVWYVITFFHSLLKAILKLQNSPALCVVASSISQLFVPHFAMSAFAWIFTISYNRSNKINSQTRRSNSSQFSWLLVV